MLKIEKLINVVKFQQSWKRTKRAVRRETCTHKGPQLLPTDVQISSTLLQNVNFDLLLVVLGYQERERGTRFSLRTQYGTNL